MIREEIQKRIVEAIREEKTIPDGDLNPESPLADVGIDSLDALNLLFVIEEAFQISIPDSSARSIKTLRDMVNVVEQLLEEKGHSITETPASEISADRHYGAG
ncbi:MAG TPA: phosphopantetheine-binding protein [Thermoanaerobaculia bacterium]|nr:phosphopantetheine-binding protein [Thermoanaerobaculia bacterium]